MRSLNKARTSSASLNVKRLRLAVIAIARLTFANMAADSGVLQGIYLGAIIIRHSLFSSERGRTNVPRMTDAPRFAEYSRMESTFLQPCRMHLNCGPAIPTG